MTRQGQPAKSAVDAALESAHRTDWGRLLALLTRQLGSLDLAEEALQDAFALAVEAWREGPIPDQPVAWLLTAARRRAIDRLRRDRVLRGKLSLLVQAPVDVPGPEQEEEAMSTIPDLRLRLLFTCCHPALALDSRVALTLRCVGGLSTAEIARAFLVGEATMAARITRAKKKIAAAGIPYREPTDAELPGRLDGVLAVLYLVFNEGYAATAGDAPIRRELCEEAIRLARVLLALAPDEPESLGLLALLLLQHARRDARFDAGRIVLLPEQDRGLWDRAAVSEALGLLRQAAAHHRPGVYQIQAAIAAEHSTRARATDTDWATIAMLYAALESLTGSPVIRLNRAVAVAERDGPAAGLTIVDGLAGSLDDYHLWHATRADLLRRLHDTAGAAAAYRRALDLATSVADRELLLRRLAEVTAE